MKLFLLYYFTKDFKKRKYAYVPGYDIDDAWERAKEMYGEECLQVMSGQSQKTGEKMIFG